MIFICKPIQKFICLEPKAFPKLWTEGDYLVRIISLGLDIGEHHLKIEIPKQKNNDYFSIRDNGYGKLVKKWDHWVFLKRIDENHTRYTDQIDIESGIFTPIAWLYAFVLYSWRQNKWKHLIQSNFKEID